MTILGIDFGTSRIKAAYWDEERGEAVMLPLGKGGRLYVPSLFHVAKDGRIRFGDEAEMMLHHDPLGVLENLKLKLGKPVQYLPGGRQVRSEELMALLFRQIIAFSAEEVKSFGGKPPEKVVLSLPSLLDYTSIYTDALNVAGYKGEKAFLREPEAACRAWIAEENPQRGEMLVVLDFGGGTVDWAAVQVDENGRPAMIPELPPGGITAAGAHVDEGLFDEMMKRLGEEQRRYAMDHRSLVMEQIRQMKESQNAKASLSGEGRATLEIMLGPVACAFDRKVFDGVVKREALDHAVEGIGGYVRKVLKTAKDGGKKQVVCALVGGTRLLSGLEEKVKAIVTKAGKEAGIEIRYARMGQADFATVRGGVNHGGVKSGSLVTVAPVSAQPVEEEFQATAVPERSGEKKPRMIAGVLAIVLILAGVFAANRSNSVETPLELPAEAPAEVPDSQVAEIPVQPEFVATASDKPTIIQTINGVKFEFVLVKGGFFTMGSNNGESDERPLHRVQVSDFYMGKYEVTQAQWKALMGNNQSLFDDDYPVTNVSWENCMQFVRELNRKTGNNYRLPTEAEWEYAAREGLKSLGVADYSGSNAINMVAWYKGNIEGDTPPDEEHPLSDVIGTRTVGGKNPNALGLYDMSGNVWEWCSDWFGYDYYEVCQNQGVVKNPNGPASGSYRVNRGGSYNSSAKYCRSTFRDAQSPDSCYCDLGFRLVFIPHP